MIDEKPRVTMEKWFFRGCSGSWQLYGEAINHPNFPKPKTFIITSGVIKFNRERMTAETDNTIYKLGEPKPNQYVPDSFEEKKGKAD